MILARKGLLTKTFGYTQNLIAACDTFRDEVLGGVTAADAKDRVYLVEALGEPDEEEWQEFPGEEGLDETPALEPRPFAIVMEQSRSHRRVGAGEWGGDGSSLVAFEVLIPAKYLDDPDHDTPSKRRKKFRNRKLWGEGIAGAILRELIENAGGSDWEGNAYLNANDISMVGYPGDPEEQSVQEYIGFSFSLNWV